MAEISVIIPIYNGAKYINQCIQNVFEQSLTNIEIICVDDGSKDNTTEILNELKKNDDRIKVYSKSNGGAGSARNLGIKKATGEYIFFLDVDDAFYSNDVLQVLYNNAKEHNIFICGGIIAQKSKNKITVYENSVIDKEGSIGFNEYQQDYYFSRFLYHRSFLINNNIFFPNLIIYEDPVFLLKAMTIAQKFYFVNKIVYVYDNQHQSVIRRNELQTIDYLKGLTHNLNLSSKYNLYEAHYENFLRLRNDACCDVENNLPSSNVNLFKALIEANEAIDIKVLIKHGICSNDAYILPTLNLVWLASNRYLKVRKNKFISKIFKN